MHLLCGLWMRGGEPADRTRLEAMCAAMQPSTPGVRQGMPAFWCEGSVGLSVLTFGATDAGAIVLSEGSKIVAADVRLHEAEELQQLLGGRPGTPAELVARAFDRFGEEAPKHILGDFALAAWDPGAGELWLTRDTAGVRPLVYGAGAGGSFLFASFPRALHASGLLPRTLNPLALLRPVLGLFNAGETLSAGVLQSPPGSILRVSATTLRQSTYWRPTRQPQRHRHPAEAAEELRALLERAVRGRIAGSGPVASHLSGGLDSSTLAILAARALRAEQRTLLAYSFLPAERRADIEDEGPFIESVLAQEPDICWKAVAPPPPLEVLGSLRDPDGGFALVGSWPENAVCADAAVGAAEIVLSGWGGDEGATYNGRGVLADAFRHGRWIYLRRELEALKRQRGFRRRNTLLGDVVLPSVPGSWFQALQRARGRGDSSDWDPSRLLAVPWRKKAAGRGSTQLSLGPNARRNQLTLLRSPHIAGRTGTWAAIGANYGLAFTFPLLDRRVLEWALSLPPHWHLRDGWKRRLLRDATAGILPETIRWRHGKLTPYPDGVPQFLRARTAVLELADRLAGNPAVGALFDTAALRAEILALPTPEACASDAAVGAVSRRVGAIGAVLEYSEYVAQHG